MEAVVRATLRDDEDVEDFLHSFFISMVRSPIPDDIHDVEAFLYTTLRNDIRDFCRHARRQRVHRKEYEKFSNSVVNTYSPENALMIEDECGKVLTSISESLPVGQARAIVLRYMEGAEIADIAEQMGVEPRSVSKYICVGLRKLRRLLTRDQDT